MNINKFRIKNYKSIIDSGDCYLTKDLTILAGKNESGKTNILEALENFNINKKIPDDVKHINKEIRGDPYITIVFKMTAEELSSYYSNFEIRKKGSDTEINITKIYPNDYKIDRATANKLSIKNFYYSKVCESNNIKDLEKKIQQTYTNLKNDFNNYFNKKNLEFFNLNMDDIPSTLTQLSEYHKRYNKDYNKHITNQKVKDEHKKHINNLQKLLRERQDSEVQSEELERWNYLFKLIPNFILFSSFDDLFPNEVSLNDLNNNHFIEDLVVLSNLKRELICSTDEREKSKHKHNLNLTINNDYKRFWIQDLTNIVIDWDSNKLYLWIKEDEEYYKPSERSKGKQWHMSFYTKVSARAKENKNNIILIDEPGLFLHATAQKDIYNKIIDSSKNKQFIFTTHSPYLINEDELYKIRLVIKKSIKKGTKIENKIHKNADIDTLTPIFTAIGLSLSEGIQNITRKDNVVVEGPSDYYYLQGLKYLVNKTHINFVYGGGSGNMGKIGTILAGWGYNVIYLLDSDQGKKDGMANLQKRWMVSEDQILSIMDHTGSIEDVFSNEDFKKFVLFNKKVSFSSRNSSYVKNNNDKVLLAKQFNEYSVKENIYESLSDDTKENIENIFSKINEKLINT